jgi:hypothetical protein
VASFALGFRNELLARKRPTPVELAIVEVLVGATQPLRSELDQDLDREVG